MRRVLPVGRDAPVNDHVNDELFKTVFRCFDAAIDDKSDEVLECLQRIGRSGLTGMYAAVGTWARVCVSLHELGGDQPGTLAVVEPDHGLADDHPMLWVSRFVAAMANDDPATCVALFLSAARADDTGDRLAVVISTMLRCAAQSVRDVGATL